MNVTTPTPEKIEHLRVRTLPAARGAFISQWGEAGKAMTERINAPPAF